MRFCRRASGAAALSAYALATLLGTQVQTAYAFDLSSLDVFGLFTKKDEPPAVTSATLPYRLEFDRHR